MKFIKYATYLCMRRAAHLHDHAWHHDDRKTNYRLKDGDRAVLLRQHVSDGWLIPEGAVCHISKARVPRVIGPGVYFAYGWTVHPETGQAIHIRVPHNALRRANLRRKPNT